MRKNLPPLILEVTAGSTFNRAIAKSLALAKAKNRKVKFCFNGHTFLINKRVPAKHHLRQFDERCEAAHRRYLKSPEYAEYQKWRLGRLERYQRIVDKVEGRLDEAIKGDPYSLVKTLYPLICSLDFIGVKVDYPRISQLLESAGYVRGELVGEPSYTRDSGGRHILGQIIDLIYHNPVYLGAPSVGITIAKYLKEYSPHKNRTTKED